MTVLQNDERANYQVDVKFQESHLKKVVDLLHCQLTEGAAVKSETNDVEMHNTENHNPSELEDGELPDSHGISLAKPATSSLSMQFRSVILHHLFHHVHHYLYPLVDLIVYLTLFYCCPFYQLFL